MKYAGVLHFLNESIDVKEQEQKTSINEGLSVEMDENGETDFLNNANGLLRTQFNLINNSFGKYQAHFEIKEEKHHDLVVALHAHDLDYQDCALVLSVKFEYKFQNDYSYNQVTGGDDVFAEIELDYVGKYKLSVIDYNNDHRFDLETLVDPDEYAKLLKEFSDLADHALSDTINAFYETKQYKTALEPDI